jgi:putative peptidoglycan lipid II flippase
MLLLRAQIVRVIYGTGKFDWNATIETANTLAFFALSLFAQALIPLLARAFFALANTKTPFIIGVISELTGIIAALILMRPLGVSGLALAFSIAAVLNVSMLLISLRNTLKTIDGEKLWSSFYRIVIAAIPMAITIQYAKLPLSQLFNQNYFFGVLGQGLMAGLAGLAIYIVICYLLKVPELLQIKDTLGGIFLKTKAIPAEEPIETNTL